MEENTVIQEAKKVSRAPIGILIAFLILLILGLIAVILGLNSNWAFKDFDLKAIFSPKQTQQDVITEPEVSKVTNTGWGIFSLPEYGFSIEVPDYKLKQTLGDGADKQDIYSYWNVKNSAEINQQSLYYDKNLYEDSVTISFYPSYLPPSVACGQGCVNEHYMNIDIYKNEGGKDLNIIKGIIEANLEKAFGFEGNDDSNYESQLVTKWNKQVLNFSMRFIGGENDGYIVVTDEYVYYITYYFSTSPTESAQIAQKVLDSMTFLK